MPLSGLTLTNGASVFLALYRPLVRLLLLLPSLLWHLPLLLAPRKLPLLLPVDRRQFLLRTPVLLLLQTSCQLLICLRPVVHGCAFAGE